MKRIHIIVIGLCGLGSFCIFLFIQLKIWFENPSATHYRLGGRFHGSAPNPFPDGKQILFSSPITGNGDIYIFDILTKKKRQLTSGADYDAHARVSPNGNLITFMRENRSGSHIWIIDITGRGSKQITFGEDEDTYPCWHPDGKRIFFTRINKQRVPSIYSVTLNDSNTKKVSLSMNSALMPECSAKSQWLYCKGSSPIGIWATELEGTKGRFVTEGSSPAISPDGKMIAFLSDPYNQTIWLADTDGSNRRRLFHSTAYKERVAYMPDNHNLLFLDEPNGRGTGDVCLLSTINGSVTRLFSIGDSSP